MGKARPTHLVDELMTELQTVEALNFLIERMETPPFFRLTCVRKGSTHSENAQSGPASGAQQQHSAAAAGEDAHHLTVPAAGASPGGQHSAPAAAGDPMSTSVTTSQGSSSVSPSAGTVRERSTSGAYHHAKKLSDDSRAHYE